MTDYLSLRAHSATARPSSAGGPLRALTKNDYSKLESRERRRNPKVRIE
ncbi:hypothetical protein [Pyxidicoccus sp. MSG2]|nr:hypothetical protein [Pyxidicoccus sp. MSG2]MCY1015595.1 hypothetical protein [Pyxidicoccus sp. MSG2]